ncbi:kinase-like protein [Cristinia sonorae]|uniref:Kinase-like protein n=1 Tax=Cristinia sonorae TaxID=1940300 RepID=A0A8K0UNR8_9AGAR|nr:kinase-like protein [Cristinia sonorae]
MDVEEKKTSHHDPERVPTPTFTTSPSAWPTPLATQVNTPVQPEPAPIIKAGDKIGDESRLSLELVRSLGQGAFSSVWLAKDVYQQLSALELSRKSSLIRSRSLNRGRRKRLEGTKPLISKKKSTGDNSVYFTEDVVGPGSSRIGKDEGRLVAVKMTNRKMCDTNDRSRVSFVREVEVLRHISHSSIVSYLHSFSTPSHHCLVLEYVGGGELFDLIDSEENHAKLDEPLLRRMFGELCKAVGWMHGVGLVHRDIKLENILLTVHPFTSDSIPAPPQPLIKLTDFGLSRFIDPAQPSLTTRCGSESYAAPELVTGRPYDGRETDAWSCGVVLYTLVTRRLPFDKARPREEHKGVMVTHGPREDKSKERRALLVRIAKCEYSWPATDAPVLEDGQELTERGMDLARREGIRRVVGKLLVRDPKKRSKIIDLWEDNWMRGEGAPVPPPPLPPSTQEDVPPSPPSSEDMSLSESPRSYRFGDGPSVEGDDEDDEEDDGEGLLVDGDDIGPGHVVRQEH